MKKIYKALLYLMISSSLLLLPGYANNGYQHGSSNFSKAMERSTSSIQQHLDAGPTDIRMAEGAFGFISKKVIAVLFPVMIVIGVLVAMVGLYSVLTNPEKTKEGLNMILFGTIGILMMYSAQYMSTVIFSDLWKGGIEANGSPQVVDLITNIYNQLLYPFLKLAIYFSLGILVVIMMTRVFIYITSQEEDVKKKASGVIIWTTAGMLLITGAKQLVEAIYGKQESVLNARAQELSAIGTEILNPKAIPIIFQVINRALGIISFILLIMIILQTYKMLTKPDDEETFKSLKQTIIYALGGLILIGSAYLLANLFIIN